MSSIFFITISSKKILACKLATDDSTIIKEKITDKIYPSDDLSENSIYVENDVIRSGNTLFVDNNWLFLIENRYNLEIYNISNVIEPEVVYSYSALSVSYDSKMIVQNNYFYIYCEHTDILHVLDCTDPTLIFERTRYTDLEGLKNFAVNDWYLYTISENNFTIYNFENFSALDQLANYFDDMYSFHDFTIKGNYSYVLDEMKGFVILNITDYSNIDYISEITLNEEEYKPSIYIFNDNLFIFESLIGLHIFDISNPLSIAKISLYDELANYSITDIFVKGNILYVLQSDGFFILDGSDLGQIQSISNYIESNFYTIFYSFMIQNDFVYLHNTYTAHFEQRTPLFIVNITNLELPIEVYPKSSRGSAEIFLLLLYIFLGAIVAIPVFLFLFAVIKSIIKDIKK